MVAPQDPGRPVVLPMLPRLRLLRAEIESMASSLAAADIPRRPLRVDTLGDESFAVWYEGDHLKVMSDSDAVFLAPSRRSTIYPDWAAIDRSEARRLACGLLGACGAA